MSSNEDMGRRRSPMPDLIQEGLSLQKAGRYAEAATCYHTLVERVPQHADAWHLLGLVLHETKNVDLALGYVRKPFGSILR